MGAVLQACPGKDEIGVIKYSKILQVGFRAFLLDVRDIRIRILGALSAECISNNQIPMSVNNTFGNLVNVVYIHYTGAINYMSSSFKYGNTR